MVKKFVFRNIVFGLVILFIGASFFPSISVVSTDNIFSTNNYCNTTYISNEDIEYWGLLIAVGVYADNPNENRPLMLEEVDDFYDLLIESDIWSEDHIKLIKAEDATVSNIFSGFKWLDQMEDEDDISLVYLTTHGGPLDRDIFPWDEEDGKDECLASYWSFAYDLQFIYDDQINYRLNQLESKGVCMIVDSCYAGGFNDDPNWNKNTQTSMTTKDWIIGFGKELSGQNRVILMASREDEVSYSGGFAPYLIDGFRGYGDINSDTTQAGISQLQTLLEADTAFAGSSVESYPEVNLAIINAYISGDSMSLQSMNSVESLRDNHIPLAFADDSVRVLVTGETAFMVDFNATTSTYTPYILAYILAFSFIILLLAFRSVVISTTAILMNLLSVGAAYGLIVLVFQKGVGAEFFGFIQVEVIETWLPLFLFALLFGLSMDYHVFLLSRVRERHQQTGDTPESVSFGLRSTGRLITGAALIMVAVFGGFALGDLAMMQQMGFGLAVAIFLDATLVRCVLVPATMRLLGRRNWYLPKWLAWIPNVSLGERPDEKK